MVVGQDSSGRWFPQHSVTHQSRCSGKVASNRREIERCNGGHHSLQRSHTDLVQDLVALMKGWTCEKQGLVWSKVETLFLPDQNRKKEKLTDRAGESFLSFPSCPGTRRRRPEITWGGSFILATLSCVS